MPNYASPSAAYRPLHAGAPRELPAGAAGTRLPSGLILSGDDAPAFSRAGFNVWPCYVQCSAKVYAGTDDIRHDAQYVVAIELNGESVGRIVGLTYLRNARAAEGIYAGAISPAVVGYLYGRDIVDAHLTLRATVPGFGCFAILTP